MAIRPQGLGKMKTLTQLNDEIAIAEQALYHTCKEHGFDDKWQYYKFIKAEGDESTPECNKAHDNYTQAVHAYYGQRDGAQGFLGKFGL